MARKQKTIHYIYKTTCLVTNRYYIGMHSTCNLEDGYMGSGKRLRYSLKKYGIDNHIKNILEYFENRELLIEGEKKAITSDMISDTNCLNLMSGGTGGFMNILHQQKACKSGASKTNKKLWVENREENVKIASIKFKRLWDEGVMKDRNMNGDKNPMFSKKHNNETVKKISESKIGTGVGENNSQYNTCWITKDGINKKIKKEDLDKFIIEGWIKGRKI